MCLPAEGIPINDLNKMFGLLNNSGATIDQINTVRKHCSQIKGGQLLQRLHPSVSLVDLVISDVPNDDLAIIGSGPTIPDTSTFADAQQILEIFELLEKLPKAIREHIQQNSKTNQAKKLSSGDLPRHTSHIISSAAKLADTLAYLASKDGLSSWVAKNPFNEDVEDVAQSITDEIIFPYLKEKNGPKLFVFYGESTVSVTGEGKGGRNQELALRGALKIRDQKNVTWLSAGTDGIDGPTDAVGAIVDGNTIDEAIHQHHDPREYLANNDSYHFHQQMGTLLKTGPTGNNLMDVVLVLVE